MFVAAKSGLAISVCWGRGRNNGTERKHVMSRYETTLVDGAKNTRDQEMFSNIMIMPDLLP